MSNKFIECEGVSNLIDDGVEQSTGVGYASKSEGGDESYTDKAKTTLKVRKQIGDGMGVQKSDGITMIGT